MKLVESYDNKILTKIRNLYDISFPDDEKKPFELILKKCEEKSAEILAIQDDNCEFLGLAITVLYNNMVLLDYFAISPEHRGNNVGSNALKMLFNRYSGRKFVLEIENTNIASDNCGERLRRKAFYIKNGMKAMPYIVNLLGVEMEIMTYNCDVTFEEYYSIYANVFSDNISSKVRLVKNL